jgi:hypothetical protein
MINWRTPPGKRRAVVRPPISSPFPLWGTDQCAQLFGIAKLAASRTVHAH